jgi:c-di-GMP-binding flagellar brake protein YcgR
VEVRLILAHGTEHPGEVVDLSAGGISLRWPTQRMVVIDEGQDVELHVRPCMHDESLAVQAAFRWRRTDDLGTVRYGFEFQPTAGQPDLVATILPRLFDRRHRVR